MKKLLGRVVGSLVILCFILMSGSILKASADTNDESVGKIAEGAAEKVTENIEYTDQDLFFEDFLSVLSTDRESVMEVVEEAEENNDDTGGFSSAEIKEILEAYDGNYEFVLYQYLSLAQYDGAVFEDDKLTDFVEEYFRGMSYIFRGESEGLDTRSGELKSLSGLILYTNSVYEMNEAYELGLAEDYVNGFDDLLNTVWLYLGSGGDFDDADQGEAAEMTSEKIEIRNEETDIAEYEIPETIKLEGDYIYENYGYINYYVVPRNLSREDMDIEINVMAYDAAGEVVAYKTSTISAVAPGASYPLKVMLTEDENAATFKTTIKASKSRYYKSGSEDLKFELNQIKRGAVVNVTNTGKEPIEFAQGTIFLFNKGKLVYGNYSYFTDDDSEIKPGETITKEMTGYTDFDEIKFYVTGRRD